MVMPCKYRIGMKRIIFLYNYFLYNLPVLSLLLNYPFKTVKKKPANNTSSLCQGIFLAPAFNLGIKLVVPLTDLVIFSSYMNDAESIIGYNQ